MVGVEMKRKKYNDNITISIKGFLICFLLIIISAFLLAFAHHLRTYFNATYLEQLLYNLFNTTTLDLVSLYKSIFTVTRDTLILICCFLVPLILSLVIDKEKKITIFGRIYQIFPIPFLKYSTLLFVVSILVIFFQLGVPNFIKNNCLKSTLYEEHYIPYEEEKVTFPVEKQNLITIYVESFETSNFSVESGGSVKKSYAPNLEMLAKQNGSINFSNTEKLGGFKRTNGTDWTIAGMVAQTSGVPIYMKTKNKENHFLEGAVSLGEILKSNGYSNYLMIGSDAEFGERKQYFQEHGNYSVYDYYYAKENRDIPYDYYVWWGYEDSKLYEFSKSRLLKIASQDEPFHFMMLTTDTHFFDGYLDESCPMVFDDQYANSFYCMDILLYNFIEWLQEQDFYSNTTVLIVGDHLAMRNDFYKISKDYERTVFNLFLNSKITTEFEKNREFTAFDMFPTTLAALGVEIEGERLALGTNLFSGEKTLSEELGYEKFRQEVQKSSKYYQENILKVK